MLLLRYRCNRKTKRKLEDEKKHIFYVCLVSLYDRKKGNCITLA